VLKHHYLWLAGGWLLVGLVMYLSLMSHPPEPFKFSNMDKLEHGFAYGLMAWWFCQLYLSTRSRLLVVGLLISMGIGLEFVQGWSGYRYFDTWDMLANSLGVLLGFGLIHTPLGHLFILIESVLRKIV